MYRIRFHGRGGQGMKTAGRILGTALFLAGYEIQDAPRYGAERRGAPMFSYVRADRQPIRERGVISRPDLVIVADDTLATIPSAAIMQGCTEQTVLFLHSEVESAVWQERLNLASPLFTLSFAEAKEQGLLSAACAAAAAALLGIVDFPLFEEAMGRELGHFGMESVLTSLSVARKAHAALAAHGGCVREGESVPADRFEAPRWIDFPFEQARLASPAIHDGATSERVNTGLWRTMRPEIKEERCKGCWWICSTFCPEGAISVSQTRRPQIDYSHCKGCLICLAQCPAHAIEAVAEKDRDSKGEKQ